MTRRTQKYLFEESVWKSPIRNIPIQYVVTSIENVNYAIKSVYLLNIT